MIANFHKLEQSNLILKLLSIFFCNIRFCIVLLKKAKTSLGWIVGSRLTWSAHIINKSAHGNICMHTWKLISFGQIASEKLTKVYEGNFIIIMNWNWSLYILMWALLIDMIGLWTFQVPLIWRYVTFLVTCVIEP